MIKFRYKHIHLVISGHSIADLKQGEKAFQSGASFITHLFNAMLPVNKQILTERSSNNAQYLQQLYTATHHKISVSFNFSFITEIRTW